jgi:hypothetical protein
MGYLGFFDVDSLECVTEEEVKHAVKESCVMIVCLNDETVNSEWCRKEWKWAEEFGVPIKCFVDIQRFVKDRVIESLVDAESREYMFQFQWAEFTHRGRHVLIQELADFISNRLQEKARASVSRRISSNFNCFVRRVTEDSLEPLVLPGSCTNERGQKTHVETLSEFSEMDSDSELESERQLSHESCAGGEVHHVPSNVSTGSFARGSSGRSASKLREAKRAVEVALAEFEDGPSASDPTLLALSEEMTILRSEIDSLRIELLAALKAKDTHEVQRGIHWSLWVQVGLVVASTCYWQFCRRG